MAKNSIAPICAHRSVATDGRIVCDIIVAGDNEVSPNLCHQCPAKAISCDHLRFQLQKIESYPITVRYATGRVEILNDHPPRVAFLRAACAERVAPIHSPRECMGCPFHSAHHSPTLSAPSMAPTAATAPRKVIPFPSRIAVG